MPRAIWKGAVSFGMVSIPIKLYTATEEKDVAFNLLHKKDGVAHQAAALLPGGRRRRSSGTTSRAATRSRPDQYVIMEPEDFDKVPVDTTHTIEITDFVPADQIDPIYYQKTYYLEPEKVGGKPFALLREVLKDSKLDRAREGDAAAEGAALHAARLRKHDRARDDVLRRRDPLDRGPRGARTTSRSAKGAEDGEVARRHAHGRLRAGEVPRQLSRGAAGADRAQGRGRGDQAARRPSPARSRT